MHTIPSDRISSDRADSSMQRRLPWEEKDWGGGPGVLTEILELKSLEAIKWRKDRAKVAGYKENENPKSIRSVKAISTLLPRCPCVITGWKPLPCEPLLYEFHWELKARWSKQGNQDMTHGWSADTLKAVEAWQGWICILWLWLSTGSAWPF